MQKSFKKLKGVLKKIEKEKKQMEKSVDRLELVCWVLVLTVTLLMATLIYVSTLAKRESKKTEKVKERRNSDPLNKSITLKLEQDL